MVLLRYGRHLYDIDLNNHSAFMCNIVEYNVFRRYVDVRCCRYSVDNIFDTVFVAHQIIVTMRMDLDNWLGTD